MFSTEYVGWGLFRISFVAWLITMMWVCSLKGKDAEWQEAAAPLIAEQRGRIFVDQNQITPEDFMEVRDMYLTYEQAERERFNCECHVSDWRERAKWYRPECIDFAKSHHLVPSRAEPVSSS